MHIFATNWNRKFEDQVDDLPYLIHVAILPSKICKRVKLEIHRSGMYGQGNTRFLDARNQVCLELQLDTFFSFKFQSIVVFPLN